MPFYQLLRKMNLLNMKKRANLGTRIKCGVRPGRGQGCCLSGKGGEGGRTLQGGVEKDNGGVVSEPHRP